MPFLDMPLFEKFVEIPGSMPLHEKRMIARTVAPHLPEAVLNRPKSGFAVPTHQWLHPDAPNTITNNRVWAQMLYKSFTGT